MACSNAIVSADKIVNDKENGAELTGELQSYVNQHVIPVIIGTINQGNWALNDNVLHNMIKQQIQAEWEKENPSLSNNPSGFWKVVKMAAMLGGAAAMVGATVLKK